VRTRSQSSGRRLRRRSVERAASAATIAVLTLLAVGRARADGISGPALVAWVPHYNQEFDWAPRHGPGCLNVEGHMPVVRLDVCHTPTLELLEPGRYGVKVLNAAPFPPLADDSGHAVFVATVGSNAHCFEEETTDDTHDLDSVVRCVSAETGENVDATFGWTYRADSTNFPQDTPYVENFAYAMVERDGTVDAAASFNPMNLHAEDVLAERHGPGDYTVVFRDLNPGDAMLDPALAPYNALVQKTCVGDLEGGAEPDGCFRAECTVRSWAPGTFDVRDTTVDVTCAGADGNPRDTAFRVYFGQEAFTSQGSWEGGFRYGWLNFDLAPGDTGCLEGDDLVSTSQHETPLSYYLGFPVRACRDELGVYRVDFLGETFLPYSIDGPNFALTTVGETPGYCTVTSSECAKDTLCGAPDGPDVTRVMLGCFDTGGESADMPWNLNVTY
jgi:hypothetical protein